MNASNSTRTRKAIVALMGPTGTGKSTFINLLTKDDNIRIGHDLDSQTVDITTSSYMQDGISVTLVDTPGFDDSREGITDTDILGKIADFLQEEGGRKINGIIYLHRISDPRMGGAAKKNLRVFREICGNNRLDHVRIVTTNWNFVDERLGNARQDALANGAFGPLINEGASLCRHDKGLESARLIMSQLIHQKPVRMMIQEELNAGWSLGDTSAGALIVKEMKELKKKHDKEVETLKKELEEASKANDEDLRLELAEERRKLQEMMTRAEEDRKTLKKTVPRETLPKSDAGKQPAATITVLFPPQKQGNETTDRGLQRQQVLHDTRRVQPAVPRVPPPARHRHHPQVLRDTWVQPAVPSVPPPAKPRHSPQRQGNVRADRDIHLPQVLHDMADVVRGYSKAGGELLGRFGAVAGGFVGLCFSPFIIARRGMDRL